MEQKTKQNKTCLGAAVKPLTASWISGALSLCIWRRQRVSNQFCCKACQEGNVNLNEAD